MQYIEEKGFPEIVVLSFTDLYGSVYRRKTNPTFVEGEDQEMHSKLVIM